MAQFLNYYFPHKANLRILDVGCGTGFNLTMLGRFGSVYGIDISQEAANYCQKRGYQIVTSNVMSMPFSENSFDIVTSLGVFYHKNVKDDLQGMREIFRVLKPGGRLFFFDCAMSCLSGNHDIVFHGGRRYMKSELDRKLSSAGFRIDRLSYVNAILFPLLFIKRRIESICRMTPKSEVIMGNYLINFLLFLLFRLDTIGASRIDYPFGINIVAHARKMSDKKN